MYTLKEIQEALALDSNPLGHTDPYILAQLYPQAGQVFFPKDPYPSLGIKNIKLPKTIIISNPSGTRYQS